MARRWVLSTTAAVMTGALVATTAGAAPPAARPGAAGMGDPYFPQYGNGGYDAKHYQLTLRLQPKTGVLTGQATITAATTQALSAFNLDLTGLTLDAVTVDGAPARTARRGAELTVTPARALPAGTTFTVVARYHGVPKLYHSALTGTGGWFRTPNGVVVAGEPEAAASWFPVNDHPRDKATYSFAVTVPKGTTALANGVPGKVTTTNGWTTFAYAEKSPMASYLATIVVGKFAVQRSTHRGLPVLLASDRGAEKLKKSALQQTTAAVDFLSTLWGPYPFDAIGGIEASVPKGAMTFALENQTRPIYPTMADPETVLHENAHQWFGDSVSVANWRDVWLNEGFATYSEWLWSEAKHGQSTDAQFREYYNDPPLPNQFWKSKVADPGAAKLFDPSIVYTRGAMSLHALRRTVGDDTFYAIARQWLQAHRDGNGSTASFIALASKVAKRDLSPLLRAWLYGTTRPANPLAGRG